MADTADEQVAVALLHEAWAVVFGGGPAEVALRHVRSGDPGGARSWVEATAAGPVTAAAGDLDRAARDLAGDNRVVQRRDRGGVGRLLVRGAAGSVEIQVRPTDGVVALRARTTPVPLVPRRDDLP